MGSCSRGCFIYVKNCWDSEPRDDLCLFDDTIEISTVMVTSGNGITYVLGIHSPHSNSIGNFSCAMTDIILSSDKLCNNICTVKVI